MHQLNCMSLTEAACASSGVLLSPTSPQEATREAVRPNAVLGASAVLSNSTVLVSNPAKRDSKDSELDWQLL